MTKQDQAKQAQAKRNYEPLVEELLEKITELGLIVFQEAIGLGRWPNGELFTDAEKPAALQAVMIYEHRHVPLEQRTGFIFKGQCKS